MLCCKCLDLAVGILHHAIGLGPGVLDGSGLDGFGLLAGLLGDGEGGPEDLRGLVADRGRGGLDGVLGPGLGIEEPLVEALDVLVDGVAPVTPEADLELLGTLALVAPHWSSPCPRRWLVTTHGARPTS